MLNLCILTKLCPAMILAGRSTQKDPSNLGITGVSNSNKYDHRSNGSRTFCWTPHLKPRNTTKEELIRDVKVTGSLCCSGHGGGSHKNETRKKAGSIPGVQKNRLWPLKVSAWSHPVQYIHREKRGPEESVEFQV